VFCCEIEDLEDRMPSIGVTLLAYVSLFIQLREELPQLESFTTAEGYIVGYILASLLPLVPSDIDNQNDDSFNTIHYSLIIYISLSVIYVIYKICKSRSKVQLTPSDLNGQQRRETSTHKTDEYPDVSWESPHDYL